MNADCNCLCSADHGFLLVVPFGRFLPIREDLERGSKPESEGGTGIARKFWEWTEEQVKAYL